MSGAVLLLAGAGGAAAVGGSGPGPLAWSDIYGVDSAFTEALAITGVTGAFALSARQSGGGGLYYSLNGGTVAYAAPFTVRAGDRLAWGVVLTSPAGRSGAITVMAAGSGATLAVINYRVAASGGLLA